MNEGPRALSGRVRLAAVDALTLRLIELTLVVTLLALVEPPQPLRALAAAGVTLVLPGLAAARLLHGVDPFLRLAVAAAAGVSTTVVLSTAMVYAGVVDWHANLALVGLVTCGVLVVGGLLGGDR